MANLLSCSVYLYYTLKSVFILFFECGQHFDSVSKIFVCHKINLMVVVKVV